MVHGRTTDHTGRVLVRLVGEHRRGDYRIAAQGASALAWRPHGILRTHASTVFRVEMIGRVAMVTAAAHRCSKQLVRDLAIEGFDIAVCSLAVMQSRVRTVESLG